MHLQIYRIAQTKKYDDLGNILGTHLNKLYSNDNLKLIEIYFDFLLKVSSICVFLLLTETIRNFCHKLWQNLSIYF